MLHQNITKMSLSKQNKKTIWSKLIYYAVVMHSYLTVTRQCQTLTIGRSAHFSLQWLLCAWRNLHLLRSFQWSNVHLDFFEFLSIEFAACSKLPNRDNHHKASYPRMQRQRPKHKLNPDRDHAIRIVIKTTLWSSCHAANKDEEIFV